MIQRVLSLLLLLSLQLSAIEYNATLLVLEAKIFPKMILLNENIDKDAQDLSIYILSEEIDVHVAVELKENIEANYPDKVSGKFIKVYVKKFDTFTNFPDAVIVLNHEEEKLEEIALWANENGVISLGYDPAYMEYGILGSLYLGISTKPYFNAKKILKHGFIFNPNLLKISKFR